MPPILTPEQALSKARNWCAKQERSHSEVRNKLYTWGQKTRTIENILAELITSGFINEERFARQYAGGKFRMKKWGKLKIVNHLRQKNISEYCLHKGISEITEKEYVQTLKNLLEKKSKSLEEKNPLIKKNKLARFLIGKGYEPELVWEELNLFFKE
jgi:regulatory protein